MELFVNIRPSRERRVEEEGLPRAVVSQQMLVTMMQSIISLRLARVREQSY